MDKLENDNPEMAYKLAFNTGYTLAEVEPELLEKILHEHESETGPYITGVRAGQKQFQNEKQMMHLEEIKRLRDRGQTKEKDIEKDL